jgi:hypothetical protein
VGGVPRGFLRAIDHNLTTMTTESLYLRKVNEYAVVTESIINIAFGASHKNFPGGSKKRLKNAA